MIDLSHWREIVVAWCLYHGLPMLIIIFAAILVRIVGSIFLERIIRRLVPASHFHSPQAEKQREDTLIRIARGTLNVLVWIIAGLMVLSQVGINIGPLLAAAGVAGLAVGFGGQYLIRDVVSGLFIILENQYRVGDVVCLDQTCGSVEDISLRMATLRDLDGAVHHVPHGAVSRVSNLSKDFARVNIDISISYRSKLETVIETINRVGEELAQDEQWKADILKPIAFERVDSFADSALIVKVLGDTVPLRQWAVAGEFRKRIKIAFDREGIEIPLPQRTVYLAS
jgi:small conductance mechanosensitive channel